MKNFWFYKIVLLLSLELCFNYAQSPKMDYDGRKTTCSTSENVPIAFHNISFEQLKVIHGNIDRSDKEFKRCNLGDDEFCDSWWLVKNWTRENSIKRHFKEFINDVRWQELKPLRLINQANDNYIFTKLLKIESNTFYVPISINGGDVDFYFCVEENIKHSDCYWLEFLTTRRIKLRRCLASTLPTKLGEIPSGMCETALTEQRLPPVQSQLWNGIILEKNMTALSLHYVSSYGEVTTIFDFSTTKSNPKIRYIFGHPSYSKNETVIIIHNYNYLQTTEAGFHQIGRPFDTSSGWLCISLYVSMCRNCRMIFMMGGHVLSHISFSDEGTWREIKMYVTDSKNMYEQLYVQTIGNELITEYNYWAIDYVQICAERHFIYLPGSRKHMCDNVNYIRERPPIASNTSLSKILLGFSGDKTDNVYNFQITSKNKTTLEFRCQLGIKNKFIYNITLELNCKSLWDLETYDESIMVSLKKCDLWQNYYCGSASIREKSNCKLKVARKPRSQGETAYYGEDINFTFEEAPLEPFVIEESYDKNDTGINIGCNRPINSNGMLRGFEVTYTNAKIFQKQLKTNYFFQRLEDSETSKSALIKIKNFSYEPCTPYFLQVRAVNDYGAGFAATKLTYSPPLLPDYLKIKKLVENSTSVDFSIRTLSRKYPTYSAPKLLIWARYLLVLLTGSEKKCKNLVKLNITNNEGQQDISHVAREFDLNQFEDNISVIFTIGDGHKGRSNYLKCNYQNGPLKTDKSHEVAFMAVSECKGKVKSYLYRFNSSRKTQKSDINITILFYFILSIIWFLVGLGTAISYNKYRKRKQPNVMYEMGRRPTTVDNIYSLSNLSKVLPNIPEDDKEILLESQMNELSTFSSSFNEKIQLRKPIKVREFEKYVKNEISKQLEEQFLGLPKGLIQPCENGKQELNKPKNRFNNIIPYDFNRVVLQSKMANQGNDYINASYIKGLTKNDSYIAAQGPKSLTINDFWLMIWQEDVRHIIMLVNLEESGQKKVEKYWPNHNEDFQFGNIHVFPHSAESMADYEVKVFRIVCEGQQRKVFHYHFLRWPDHGVPIHFHTLLPFIRKTLEISTRSRTLVHCCTGTSATGVFILCDICLRAARETGVLDILNVASELRKQRINMIENIFQYKLAHLVIMEILTGLQSSVSCSDDIDKFTVKLTSPEELMLQMQYLDDTCWQYKVLAVPPKLNYPFEIFPKKNKSQNVVPDATEAIQLGRYPPSDKSSAYINAVKVDGYHYPEKYVVTQQPMPNTLNDFWRMIVCLNIETIISLNEVDMTDHKSCSFWPTEANPQMSPVDFIILNYSSHTEIDNFEKIVVHVLVEGKEKKYMKVNIISLKGWPAHNIIPDDFHGFLKFYCYADAILKQFPQCCVTCYDGNLASGIFVGTAYLLEKIKLEKCYDVCEAVKVIRRNRKEFISEKLQLAFLYEIASTYIKGFETYANFSTSLKSSVNIYDYIE